MRRTLFAVLLLIPSVVFADVRFASLKPASTSIPAEAMPTPYDEVGRILRLLPKPDVAFVDFGCGADARFCIAAAERWRCRVVGIEIDPERAAAARQCVRNADLGQLITIVTGDATAVDVKADVGVAYLFPETLAKLKPRSERLRAFASYIHKPEGMSAVKNGNAWIYNQPVEYHRPAFAVWAGQQYAGPVCDNPNCGMCASIRAQLAARPIVQEPAKEIRTHAFATAFEPGPGIKFGVLPSSSAKATASPGTGAGCKIRPDLGSGVNTDAGVLTCLHVVRDTIAKGKPIEVDCGGEVVQATLIFQDPKTDVAILKAAWKNEHPTIPVHSVRPNVGDQVRSVARLRDGTIGVESHKIVGSSFDGMIVVDNPFIASSSGGAVLNAEGELIGIISGNIVTAEPWQGLVIPIRELPKPNAVASGPGKAPARSAAVQVQDRPTYQIQCNGRSCRRVRIR